MKNQVLDATIQSLNDNYRTDEEILKPKLPKKKQG